jgi:hypothetical protein
MKQDTEKSKEDNANNYKEPNYFKALNSKWSNDRVGQCFIIASPKKTIENVTETTKSNKSDQKEDAQKVSVTAITYPEKKESHTRFRVMIKKLELLINKLYGYLFQ